MDIGAYMQINVLDEIAKANGIEVPRLRGYRLMEFEEPLTEKDIQDAINSQKGWLYEQCCCSYPRFYPESNSSIYGPVSDRLKKKYLIIENEPCTRNDGSQFVYHKVVGFRWDLLHGKARKRLKLAIKRAEKRVRNQLNTFNKYVGRNDVLYIHARIGGPNWHFYDGKELEKQPWFIEKVDDHFDYTYCDIYARIDDKKEF